MKYREVELNLGGGSLLQLANRTHCQMMSYLITAPSGEVVVIDGGTPGDGEHLYEELSARGKRVSAWFITHGHNDHFGALLDLLERRADFDVEIDSLYFNFPPLEWFAAVEPRRVASVEAFLRAVQARGLNVVTPEQGAVIDCGGVSFEVVRDCGDYQRYHRINDSTILLRAQFPGQAVLFLGDLGEAAGMDLLRECDSSKLRCDVVQMAHHGQDGVNRVFYETVRPRHCLYPAPDWLWNNDIGGGKGSGPWKTLITRGWMEELGDTVSYPMADGDYLFR